MFAYGLQIFFQYEQQMYYEQQQQEQEYYQEFKDYDSDTLFLSLVIRLSGTELKKENNETKEFHQLYFCFLVEQFILDQ